MKARKRKGKRIKHYSKSASAKREVLLQAPQTAISKRRKRRRIKRKKKKRRTRNTRRTSHQRGRIDRVHAHRVKSEPRDGYHLNAISGQGCHSAIDTSTFCRKGRSSQPGRHASRSVTLSLNTRSSSCRERQAPVRRPRCLSSCSKPASLATKMLPAPSQEGVPL